MVAFLRSPSSYINQYCCSFSSFKNHSGFTLIELLIAVVIVSILAAISIPTYAEYILKSKRSLAKVALLELAQAQEKYYAENLKYAKTINELSISYSKKNNTYMTEGKEYILTVVGQKTEGNENCDNNTIPCFAYYAKALANGSQLKDTKCKIFTINNLGEQVAKDSSNNISTKCW